MKNKKKFNIFFKILIILGIFSISQLSIAQDTTLISDVLKSEVVTNDVSIIILSTLFGGLPIFGGGEDALQNVFRIFNICVLSIGGVLASYTLLLSIVATANSGKALGDYNSTMTPMRTAAGVALILPIANGYALIQIIVMWLIVQGIMIADIVWSTFVSAGSLSSALAVSPIQPESKQLAKNVLLSSMCMAAVQRESDINNEGLNMAWTNGWGKKREIIGVGSLEKIIKAKEQESIKLTAGETAGRNGIPTNACGEITINRLDIDDAWHKGIDKKSKTVEAIDMVTGVSLGGFSGYLMAGYSAFRIAVDSGKERTQYKNWLKELSNEQALVTENLLIEAGIIANEIVNQADNDAAVIYNESESRLRDANKKMNDLGVENNEEVKSTLQGINTDPETPATMKMIETLSEEEVLKKINNLASLYQVSLREKALKTYKSGDPYSALVENANSYGWAMAGTFFVQMGGMSDAINQILLNMPSATPAFENPKNLSINSQLNGKYMSKLKYYYSLDDNLKEFGREIPVIDKGQKNKETFIESGFNITFLLDNALKDMVSFAISDNEHPIMQLKRLGSLMLSTVGPIMTHMFQNVKEASGSGILLSLIAYTLIGVMLTGGITLSYVLPLLPTLIWLGMLFGWLVMVFEAMIASPLWVVMHLSPTKQDDFIGAQKNGYMLVFTLIVRPVLMVLGFICAIVAITVLGYFINSIFLFIYSMTQFGTTGFVASILSTIVVPLMYAGIVYIALKEMIKIMYKIPDELLSWFGGGGPQLGGYGESMGGDSTRVFAMMGGVANQPVTAISQQANSSRGKIAGSPDAKSYKNALEGAILGSSKQDTGGFGGMSGNDLSKKFSKDSINGIAGAQSEGIVSSGSDLETKDFFDGISPSSKSMNNDAINDTLGKYRADGRNNVPLDEFKNDINSSLNNRAFGEENSGKLNNLKDLFNARAEGSGDNLLRGAHKKAITLSENAGMSLSDAYNAVGNSIVSSTSAYMNDSESNGGIDSGSFNPTNTADENNKHLRSAVGKMANAVRGMVYKENRDDTMGMGYDSNTGKFSKIDLSNNDTIM